MDISDSYEHQTQQGDPQQQQPQQQQQQQQLMQCETIYGPSMNGWNAPLTSSGQAIPLPAPPISKTPQQQAALLQSQPLESRGEDIDIDSMLLQQFSCLGTTDHEDLENQFLHLTNNQMNKESARFYLEMSNWNLQTAVGCYLDFYNFHYTPSVKVVHKRRISEFQHTWRLQNDGTLDWPTGCYLRSSHQTRCIDMPALKPGDTCDILAQVMSPQLPASTMMWQMCSPNGWNVGEPLLMSPGAIIDTDSQSELSNRMSQLLTSSDATNSESYPQVNVVISANME